jgi:hypothetical protein
MTQASQAGRLATTKPIPAAKTAARGRPFLILCICASAALTLALAFYGWDYYGLDQASRPFSPKHRLLRPSGLIGLRLGMLGFVLFCLVFLYPLRKRWRWLSRKGKTRVWLDYHVLLGLTAPAVITFHSSFKFNGLAGMAYWVMVALVISGIIGRYFYSQVPRTLEAAEMSLRELKAVSENLQRDLLESGLFPPGPLLKIFHLPSPEQVERMSIILALGQIIKLDILRPFQAWRLQRMLGAQSATGGGSPNSNAGAKPVTIEVKRIVKIARQQAAISQKILFLSRAKRVFHLWHVIHRPFSYTFVVLVLVHVAVALLFGFY